MLFVSQSLPYPPDSGGTQRTYHVLRELQKGFDVHLLPFSRRRHQPTAKAREEARARLSRYVTRVYPPVPYSCEWSPKARVRDHFLSTVTGRAYSYYQYSPPEFERAFREAVEEASPDLIHFDSIDFHRHFLPDASIPQTCTHHDIESSLLARRAVRARNPLLAGYLKLQAARLREVERRYAPMVDLNLTMSEVDRALLESHAPGSQVMEVPNAVSPHELRAREPDGEDPGTVVFVGPTYLFANRDAVDFLLKEIWPRVRSSVPEARLVLVGRNNPGERERFSSHPGVEARGRVEEVPPHLGSASCSVIPIRVGGGTRIKILESWALGRAVVTTSRGCEGLAVRDGLNALVRDDPREFASAVVEVLRNGDRRGRLGAEGRRTVEEKYSWERVGEKLRSAYRALIASGPSSRNIWPGRGHGRGGRWRRPESERQFRKG